MASAERPAQDVPKVIWSWAMFDWANSAFTTLVITFIYATYFTTRMAPDEVTGTAWWSRAVSISAVLTAVLTCRVSSDQSCLENSALGVLS